jgi:hypothetical protein
VITTKCEKFQGGNGQDAGSSAVLKTYCLQPVEEIMEVLRQTAIYGGLTAASESLRACARITSHFRIPSSGHLCPILNRKVLEIGLLFLWLCNFGSNKSDLNLGANSVKLFLRKPDRNRDLGGFLTSMIGHFSDT